MGGRRQDAGRSETGRWGPETRPWGVGDGTLGVEEDARKVGNWAWVVTRGF